MIGGYYDGGMAIEDEIAAYRELGLAGCKFKVGGRSPEEDAARVLQARAAAGDDFVLCIDANQGYTVRRRSTSAAGSRARASAGSRSRAAGTTIAATCATCGRWAGSPSAPGRPR